MPFARRILPYKFTRPIQLLLCYLGDHPPEPRLRISAAHDGLAPVASYTCGVCRTEIPMPPRTLEQLRKNGIDISVCNCRKP
jgi:hypothetical protein